MYIYIYIFVCIRPPDLRSQIGQAPEKAVHPPTAPKLPTAAAWPRKKNLLHPAGSMAGKKKKFGWLQPKATELTKTTQKTDPSTEKHCRGIA